MLSFSGQMTKAHFKFNFKNLERKFENCQAILSIWDME